MCGIFGYIGKRQPLKKDVFVTLGVLNDSRGGDNCGIMINRQVEYGEKLKLFNDFYPKSKLLKATDQAGIALGHCRKASVGGIHSDLSQPVIITGEKGDIDFVLLHNGTIKNYKELAKKYNIDIEAGYSDSQVMALLFYHVGFKVLSEYEGTAVFVCVDYRKVATLGPITYIFKGGSKKYKTDTEIYEERPLYLLKLKEEKGWWFSSLGLPLKSLFYTEIEKGNGVFFQVPVNVLYKVVRGKLDAFQLYDRSECFQDYISTSYTNAGFSTYPTYQAQLPLNIYGEESDEYIEDTIMDMESCRVVSTYLNNFANCIFYRDGYFYKRNGKTYELLHGKISMSSCGYIGDSYSYYKNTGYFEFCFYQGILMKHEKYYTFLMSLTKFLDITPEEFCEDIDRCDMLAHCSYYPVFDAVDGSFVIYNFIEYEDNTVESNVEFFDGSMSILASPLTLYFTRGKLKQQYYDSRNTVKIFEQIQRDYNEELEDLEPSIFWNLLTLLDEQVAIDYISTIDEFLK